MKGILLLNGEPPEEKIRVEKDDFVACCDGAYRWAMDKAGRVDLLTGDFDSLGYVPENGVRYPEILQTANSRWKNCWKRD